MIPVPPLPSKPPLEAAEAEMLRSFLDYLRGVMLRKVAGLSEDDLRRTTSKSTLTLLGILKHLAYVERAWFRMRFAGEDVAHPSTEADPDADFRAEPHETAEEIASLYRSEIEHANRIAAGASLDDLSVWEAPRDKVSMRWILVHMIEETARHLGHADLIRESIDGATGD